MIPYAITMSLLLDFAEQILCNQAWHLGKPNPITSLPIPQQIFFTILCGVHAFAGNELAFGQPRGLIYVLILRLPPSSSPPVYDGNPLRARSLAELWSVRWHLEFRRLFERLSLPSVWLLSRFSGGGDRPANPNITKVFRQPTIFSPPTLLHAGISYSIPTLQSAHTPWSVVEFKQIKFFLAQPVGLLIEAMAVKPATKTLPRQWEVGLRRAFIWSWLI
ncbi:hypothetical protein FRB97_005387 [Tulasnella sp. 331]|nr:hypothetical protein FRB97_005387 [Tulasnella sp. 331]